MHIISYQKIFQIATFAILTGFITPLQGLIDIALIAQSANTAELSAIGLATQLLAVVFVSFNFLQYATSGQTAQAIGQKTTSASILIAIWWRACLMALVFGLLLFVSQKVISNLGLSLLSGSFQAKLAAQNYLSVRFLGAPAQLIYFSISGFLIGLGQTRLLFLVQSSLTLSNIILSLVFVKIFHLGIVGIALGTTIAFWMGVFWGIWLIKRQLRLSIKEFLSFKKQEFTKSKLKQLLILNKDIFIRTLILTLCFAWITKLASLHGDVFLASYTLLMQIMTLSAYALDGIALATETLCGMAIGKQKRLVFYLAVKKTGIIIAIFACILSIIWFYGIDVYLHLLAKNPSVFAVAKQHSGFVIILPIIGVWAYWLDGVYFGATAGQQIRCAYLLSGALFFIGSVLLSIYFSTIAIYLSIYLLFILRAGFLGVFLPKLTAIKFSQ